MTQTVHVKALRNILLLIWLWIGCNCCMAGEADLSTATLCSIQITSGAEQVQMRMELQNSPKRVVREGWGETLDWGMGELRLVRCPGVPQIPGGQPEAVIWRLCQKYSQIFQQLDATMVQDPQTSVTSRFHRGIIRRWTAEVSG